MPKRKYTKKWQNLEYWYKQLNREMNRSEVVDKIDAKGRREQILRPCVPPAVRARIMADIFKAILQVQAKRTPPAPGTPEESKFNAESALKALNELTNGRNDEKPRNSSSMDARRPDVQTEQDSAVDEGRLGGKQEPE